MKNELLNEQIKQLDTLPSGVKWNPDEGWRRLEPKLIKSYFGKHIAFAIATAAIVTGIAFFLISPESQQKHCTGPHQIQHIVLCEGVELDLNANSVLFYNSDSNLIELEGEAYFSINKPDGIVIRQNAVNFHVKNANFNTRKDSENKSIIVNVEEGELSVVQNAMACNILMEQQGTLIPGVTFMVDNQINPNYKAWLTKTFVFEEFPLYLVAKQLNETFGVTIEFVNPKLRYCKINSTIKAGNIDEAIKELSGNKQYDIYQANDEYVINGNGC